MLVRDETIMVRRTIKQIEDFVYKDVRNKIDECGWVSFDIFDTLVKRTVAKPSDLFLLVGKREKEILKI